MDSNPIRHPSPAQKKMKCSFLDYIQLLMIGWAGQWTRTPSATPCQPKNWNACFWITFNFWWSAGLVNGLKPHLPPLSSQNHEMLVFGLHSTSDDWLGSSAQGFFTDEMLTKSSLPIQWQIQDFLLGGGRHRPIGGGTNLRHIHFSVKTYVEMKEMDPVGGACWQHPLDPPMPLTIAHRCCLIGL